MRKKSTITQATLDKITGVLIAKGLDPEKVPAEFVEACPIGLRSLDLDELKESQAQTLLTWLSSIPDDQPAEQEAKAPADETQAPAEGNGEIKEQIRKAEDSLTIKRPLSPAECQESLAELYELESRRATVEMELEGHKGRVKASQKEIETIDGSTYRIIRNIKANQVEETVPALRVTNLTTGMITWFHADTGELLREKAIEPGEPLPLDLSGDAGATTEEPPTKHVCNDCVHFSDPATCVCDECVQVEDFSPSRWAPIPAAEELAAPPAETAPEAVRTCYTCARHDISLVGGCKEQCTWEPRPDDEPPATEENPAEPEAAHA